MELNSRLPLTKECLEDIKRFNEASEEYAKQMVIKNIIWSQSL